MNNTRLSTLAPEPRLLFMLLDRRAGVEEVVRLIEGGIDWRYFSWLANRERADSMVWRHLSTLPEGTIPGPVISALQRLTTVTEFRMLRLRGRLEETLAALNAAGIDVIMLKGAALASTLYPTFSARPMGDLDLLVRSEQGLDAWRVVQGIRWRSDYGEEFEEFYSGVQHFPPLTDEDGTDLGLDLHTALFSEHHPFALSLETLWETAVPVPSLGAGVSVLSPLYQALHISIHFAWSHVLRSASWRSFSDLRVLVDTGELDWDELAEVSEATRASTSTYWTLRLARALVGLEVPERVLARLAPTGPAFALRFLERHYLANLTPGLISCPSTRLSWAMWEWGLRPGSSGHGESRPWSRDRLFREAADAAAGEEGGTASGDTERSRLWGQVSHLGDWWRYLGRVSGLISGS